MPPFPARFRHSRGNCGLPGAAFTSARGVGPTLLRKRRAISLLSKPDEFSDLGPTKSLKCNGLLTTKGNAQ